jgi:hypothetical protein
MVNVAKFLAGKLRKLSKTVACTYRSIAQHNCFPIKMTSHQCCGSGSGIRDPEKVFFSDPGSQTHIFESLVTNFWVKISIIL